jgi:hypothetical protein
MCREKSASDVRPPGPEFGMKLTGFLILLAGWGIVLAALVLLGAAPARTGFVWAGVGVEVLGLVLILRGHLIARGERR